MMKNVSVDGRDRKEGWTDAKVEVVMQKVPENQLKDIIISTWAQIPLDRLGIHHFIMYFWLDEI